MTISKHAYVLKSKSHLIPVHFTKFADKLWIKSDWPFVPLKKIEGLVNKFRVLNSPKVDTEFRNFGKWRIELIQLSVFMIVFKILLHYGVLIEISNKLLTFYSPAKEHFMKVLNVWINITKYLWLDSRSIIWNLLCVELQTNVFRTRQQDCLTFPIETYCSLSLAFLFICYPKYLRLNDL